MSFEHDKRIIVYPNYIDNTKTVAQGRRIPKELACQEPTAIEIYECIINGLKLEADAEYKHYPRDWMVLGRVRVKLRNDDGSPANPDIATRRTLLIKIAELVPKHPKRVDGKPARPTSAAAAAKAAAAAQQAGSSAASSSKQQQQQQGGSSKKKSSKKK